MWKLLIIIKEGLMTKQRIELDHIGIIINRTFGLLSLLEANP